MDYLLHHNLNRQFQVKSGQFFFDYGIGVRARFENNPRVGIRIPLGLDFVFSPDIPLDIFGEVVPLLDLIPGTDFTLNAGLGIRYWFK